MSDADAEDWPLVHYAPTPDTPKPTDEEVPDRDQGRTAWLELVRQSEEDA